MSLNTGTRFGPYEILSLLGAGGMGEVYKARDTRLDRDVALKVLTAHVADDPPSRARFQREARAVAALNHPHICTLHDVGSEHGIDFLVMEYLDGQTLADRLKRGPLPLDEALKMATEIGDALDKAHRTGIVHRDLKPSNVMLTKAGVKLLDFGLAKLLAAPHDGGVTAALTQSLSREGMLVGTVPYMAPEQLEGREADARSDLFAFGAVLYEMVSGRRPFVGESQASVIAAILERDPPPISTLQPLTPPALDRLVRTCLAKDPDNRWQTARDLVRELTWIKDSASEAGVVPRAATRWRNRERLAWSAGILLILALAVFLGKTRTRSTSPPLEVVRAPLLPPSESSFLPYTFATSPDGTRVAFASAGQDGNAALWVRALSGSNAQLLKGTEGPAAPFWSPDNRHIGFFADGKLKTVDIDDGSVEILIDAPAERGGTWNRDGTIVFAPAVAGPLYRISQTGGVAAPLTRIPSQPGSQSHRFPFFLPDGKHFLYFVQSPDNAKDSGIYVSSLDSNVAKRVAFDSNENAAFAAFAAGRLLYVRGRRLMAQPFDPDRFETTGPAVTIADGVETDVGGRPEFSVSQNGVLVFQSEAPPSRLVWYDGNGKELSPLPILGSKYPRFSPDGHSLAFSSDDARNGKYKIHIYDLARGINRPLTDSGSDTSPVWSPDGKEITYDSTEGTKSYMYTIPVDGSNNRRVQLKGGRMVPNDWSQDGHLVFMDFSKGRPRLAIYSASDRKVASLSGESEAQFSPDGKWVAYSGKRGRLSGEIIVQPFPSLRGSLQISTAGGGQPRWNPDGRRISYLAPDKKMMSVTFDPQSMTASAPQVLFQTRIISFAYDFYQYDVAPDGRFLINSLPASFSSPLTLVTGWTALLKEQ